MKSNRQQESGSRQSETRRRGLSDDSNWQDLVKTGQTEIKQDDQYVVEPLPQDSTIQYSPITD